MKLLFIAPSAYLLGGVQDWLYLLTIGLRKRGHNVTVGIPDGIYHRAGEYNSRFQGIDAISFKNKSGTHEGRIRAIAKFLVNNPADLIIGVNIGDLYDAYIRSYHLLKKTHLVMTLHAIETDYFGDIRNYSQLLDSVITTNKLTQRIIIEQNLIDSDRVMYAPYGVKVSVPKSNYIHSSELRIAWVGRIDNDQKRVSDITQIITNLDKLNVEYCLSIAGDGPYLTQLSQDLEYWINQKKVKLVGLLNKYELEDFYSKHNVLLITSEWETGPIVAWEAMAAGIVVVSSQYIGSISENALVDGVTALLYPTGAGDLAANQISRLRNLDLRNQLATNAQRMLSMRYSEDVCLMSWEQTFLRIIHQPFRKSNPRSLIRPIPLAGKLDLFLGRDIAEILRESFLKRGFCYDPGSEWPHSMYSQSEQQNLLDYAKNLETNA
jgi:glycosyltransferase involved in cell wall biosynthesis